MFLRSRRPAAHAAMVVALAGPAPPASSAPEEPVLEVRLRVRIARCPPAVGTAAPVRDDDWVRGHIEEAARVLAPHRIKLEHHQESFDPATCELLDRAHRDAMAEHVEMGREVTVLVLSRVRDLDVESYDLMGVHWRYGGEEARLRGRRWIFLTARAKPPVLAHELGHYFGLGHDPAGGNLMTPGPSSPVPRGIKTKPFEPVLTAAQAARLRRSIRKSIR